jgi:hypothetical protein
VKGQKKVDLAEEIIENPEVGLNSFREVLVGIEKASQMKFPIAAVFQKENFSRVFWGV